MNGCPAALKGKDYLGFVKISPRGSPDFITFYFCRRKSYPGFVCHMRTNNVSLIEVTWDTVWLQYCKWKKSHSDWVTLEADSIVKEKLDMAEMGDEI